ncbi:MAG TPA: DMT family transporter [Thermoanaerobaculia bacterium]|nr:DMT family transporter [Thermoanaerobaculia bacterium]
MTEPGADNADRAGALGARLAIVAAAVLFSTGGTAIKATELTAWQVASLRSGIAALALALLVPRAVKALSWRAGLVGVAYAATMILYVAANKYTTAANAIFLQSTAPLYILLLSPRLLGERVRRGDLGWMALIGLGLAAFFAGEQEPFATAPRPALGNLLGAVSGVSWAFTILGLRWLGSAHLRAGGDLRARPGAAAAIAGNLIACFACLPWALPLGRVAAGDWLTVTYLGVLQIGLAYVLLTASLERVPAFEASLLLLIEPAASPLWAWLVHREVPGPWAWAGGALILAATTGKAAAAERRRRRAR